MMTTQTLKFTGKFNKGDEIRGQDFPGRNDCYVQGIVVDANHVINGVQTYMVDITARVLAGQPQQGETVGFIPHEIDIFERDDRITLVKAASTGPKKIKAPKVNYDAILDEAFAAAAQAAADVLTKMGGDRGACGFAWVIVKPARGAFYDALKARSEARLHENYGSSGKQLWNPSRNNCQNIDAKEAGCVAFLEVMAKHGIAQQYKMSYNSRLD